VSLSSLFTLAMWARIPRFETPFFNTLVQSVFDYYFFFFYRIDFLLVFLRGGKNAFSRAASSEEFLPLRPIEEEEGVSFTERPSQFFLHFSRVSAHVPHAQLGTMVSALRSPGSAPLSREYPPSRE